MFFRDNRTSGLQRKDRQVRSYLLRILNPNFPHLLLHFTMYKLTATAIFKSRVHFVERQYTSHGLNQSRLTYVRNKNTVKKNTSTPKYKVSMVMNQAYTFQGGTFSLAAYAKIIQLWITTMRKTQLETMFVLSWFVVNLTQTHRLLCSLAGFRQWTQKTPPP